MKHIHIPAQNSGAPVNVMTGYGTKQISVITDGLNIETGDTLTYNAHYNNGDYKVFEVIDVAYSRPAIMAEGGKYPYKENPVCSKFTMKETGETLTIEEIENKL